MSLNVWPTAAGNRRHGADITEAVLCVCWQKSFRQSEIELWQETAGTKNVVGWQVKPRPTSIAAWLPLA